MHLNADIGEGGANEAELFEMVTMVNVACGGHAGDGETMAAACALAANHGVAAGAHPGYEDRVGFGRREAGVPPEAIHDAAARQLGVFAEVADSAGIAVAHVKPHGALYHRLSVDPEAAEAFTGAVAAILPAVPLVGLPDSRLEAAAAAAGMDFLAEGFADRAYLRDGRLVPRGDDGALLEPIDAHRQVLMLLGAEPADQGIPAGRIDTVCVHGDRTDVIAITTAVLAAFAEVGVDPGGPWGSP